MADLVPLADAAKEFGVSTTTLFRYLANGQLKRYKKRMDRKTYVDRVELRRITRAYRA